MKPSVRQWVMILEWVCPIDRTGAFSMSYSMSDLLQLVVSEGASDLHIRVGVPPTIRVHGVLHRVEGPSLKPEDTEELMRSITSEENIQSTRERGGADFGFAFGEAARFRVSVFKEKGNF